MQHVCVVGSAQWMLWPHLWAKKLPDQAQVMRTEFLPTTPRRAKRTSGKISHANTKQVGCCELGG